MLGKITTALVGLACLLSLSACNLTTNELLSTGATAGAALVTTAAGLPPIATVTVATTAGVLTGVVTDEPEVDLAELPPEVAKQKLITDLLMDIWHWIVGGVVALIAIAWLIPGPQSIFRRK